MFSVVWVTVGLLPLWHGLKIHIISYHITSILWSEMWFSHSFYTHGRSMHMKNHTWGWVPGASWYNSMDLFYHWVHALVDNSITSYRPTGNWTVAMVLVLKPGMDWRRAHSAELEMDRPTKSPRLDDCNPHLGKLQSDYLCHFGYSSTDTDPSLKERFSDVKVWKLSLRSASQNLTV